MEYGSVKELSRYRLEKAKENIRIADALYRDGHCGVIRRAAMLREESDYEDFYQPEPEDTEEVIGQVQGFIEMTAQYLRGQGVL